MEADIGLGFGPVQHVSSDTVAVDAAKPLSSNAKAGLVVSRV